MGLHQLVSEYASENVLAGLSDANHEPEEQIRLAVSGAVPAVLLMLTDACATPGGAEVVFRALDARGPSMLDRLPSAFVSDSAHLLIETGYRHLSGIVGRASVDELVYAIGEYADISHGAAHSVVGMASCIVLSAISRDIAPENAHALATHLNDEKPDVLAALPAGLSACLERTAGLRPLAHQYDSGSPATGTDNDMQDEAALPRQENFHNERYYRVDQSAGLPQEIAWLVPILIVAAIISATVFLLHPRNAASPVTISPRSNADDGAVPAAGILPAADRAAISLPSDPDLGTELASILDNVTGDLSNAKTFTERRKALADDLLKLQDLTPRIDRLPPAERRVLAELINKRLPEIDTMSAGDMLANDPVSRQSATEIRRQLRTAAQEAL